MDAIFMEKIVKRKKEPVDNLKIAGIIFAVFVVIVLSISIKFLSAFALFLVVGAIWGAWLLISGMNMEYEYSVTDNFFDVDCIVAQRKRSRVFSGDAKEFEICARVSSDLYREYSKGNKIILNFAPTDDPKKNYFLITKNNSKKAKTKGQMVMVVFEPDERMIPSIRKYNPSKIKVDGFY